MIGEERLNCVTDVIVYFSRNVELLLKQKCIYFYSICRLDLDYSNLPPNGLDTLCGCILSRSPFILVSTKEIKSHICATMIIISSRRAPLD